MDSRGAETPITARIKPRAQHGWITVAIGKATVLSLTPPASGGMLEAVPIFTIVFYMTSVICRFIRLRMPSPHTLAPVSLPLAMFQVALAPNQAVERYQARDGAQAADEAHEDEDQDEDRHGAHDQCV